jgi:hypothetical protein
MPHLSPDGSCLGPSVLIETATGTSSHECRRLAGTRPAGEQE